MLTNIWIDDTLKDKIQDIFPKKRRLDFIPAICDKKQGVCLVSIAEDEVKKILKTFERGIMINATGGTIANISNTSILIDVVSISPVTTK